MYTLYRVYINDISWVMMLLKNSRCSESAIESARFSLKNDWHHTDISLSMRLWEQIHRKIWIPVINALNSSCKACSIRAKARASKVLDLFWLWLVTTGRNCFSNWLETKGHGLKEILHTAYKEPEHISRLLCDYGRNFWLLLKSFPYFPFWARHVYHI